MISTMFDVKVDRPDPVPLQDQVAAHIRRAIAEGRLALLTGLDLACR
jgi:DNA-binding GntR family transcriptional regulator